MASDGVCLVRQENEIVQMMHRDNESEELLQSLLADHPALLSGRQVNSGSPRCQPGHPSNPWGQVDSRRLADVAVREVRTYRGLQGGTKEPHMGESGNDAVGRWLNEGGHGLSDHDRADLLARIAAADQSQLAALWSEAVARWGDGASRLWQEALSAYDASDT